MIAATFSNCAAVASELPPNFTTMGFMESSFQWRYLHYFRTKSPAASTMFSRKTAFSAKNLRAGEKHLSFCQERTKPPDKRPAAHDTVSFAKALAGAGLCSARWAGANLHSTL